MKNKLLTLLLNSYFIAFVISLVIIYFLPDYFTKYKVELVNTELISRDFKIYFEDLDNDQNSEKIISYYNLLGNASFEIHKPNGDFVDQWNFPNKHSTTNKSLWFFDVNDNGYKEIYLITQKKDSLFLNIEEPFVKNGIHKKNIFIDLINEHNGIFNVITSMYGVSDVTSNGNKEIFFCINSGFSGSPRNAYKYNLANNQISKSPHLTNPSTPSQIIDLDDDGEKEIILKSYSAGNSIDPSFTKRSDHSSWFTVLDKDLNFRFEPIEIKSEFSSIQIIPFKSGSEHDLLCFINSKQTEKYPDKLCVYSNNGILLKEKIIPSGNYKLFSGDNVSEFMLFNRVGGEIQKMNYALEEMVSVNVDPNYALYCIDIDKVGEKEWLSISKDQTSILIYRANFKFPVAFQIPKASDEKLNFGLKQISKTKNEICFQKGNEYFVYSYFEDPFYPFRYLIYLGVFLLVLASVWLIQIAQKIRMEKQRAIERQIAELQIKTIKNQVDPHFVFNAINTISEMTLTDNKIEADNFICKFSDFMRGTLQNSDKISCTLKEEIDYVENFIQLQKIRYNNSFDYQINIDKNVNINAPIPKHILFCYVENAIKHGLSRKIKSGLLKIKVSQNSKQLILLVEDNGTGLDKSKTIKKDSTGNGLKIMEQVFTLYSKLYKKKINHKLTELFNKNNEKVGLKVIIEISK